nr:hypothetical protein [Tanacetum cinerariifolium]
IHQSRGSCVEGLFAVINNEFEEWAWSYELTSFLASSCNRRDSYKFIMNIACDQVEFRRISLTGFRSCASCSQTEASQSRQSTEMSIFTVSTYVSLGCSGNTTWIMRRTLEISFTFHSV